MYRMLHSSRENINIYICIVYRPPPSPVNQLNTNVFLREWAEFLSQFTTSTPELKIFGDINLHLDNTTHPHTTDMMHTCTLQSCGLQQHINQPTHHHGHTLDVLITRDTSAIIGNVDVEDIGLCDDKGTLLQSHYAITCERL